jgi:hypothetical protein
MLLVCIFYTGGIAVTTDEHRFHESLLDLAIHTAKLLRVSNAARVQGLNLGVDVGEIEQVVAQVRSMCEHGEMHLNEEAAKSSARLS